MTMHSPRFRGVVSARADGGDAMRVLDELKKTVTDFKAAHEEELKGIKKNFADVVTTEKVERINSEISALQKAIDDINTAQAAARLGGGAGSPMDPAAKEHAKAFGSYFRQGIEAGLRDMEARAQLESGSDPDGGYLVPTQMEQSIDRVLGTVSSFRGLASTMTIGTDSYKKQVNVGGTASGWVGENEGRPETQAPTLRELEFSLQELYAFPFSTQRTIDDARLDVEQWLANEVATVFAEQESQSFLVGDGIRKPRGLLSYPTVANASWAWGKLGYTVTGGASGFASTAPADAFIDLYYALKAGYRTNASWLTSDAVMKSIRKFKDGDGNYLWAPPTAPDAPSTLLGKPVHTDDYMPELGAGAFPVAFGDFRRAYLILDRIGIRVLRDALTVKGKVGFYTTKRVGGGLQNFEAVKLLKCAAT